MAAFTAKLFISLIIILPQISWGRVLTDDITITSKETFTLKELCQEMVTHPSPLIEVKSITTVDCMGKKIKVTDFCQKKMVTDPYYLRGYASNDKVECISGKKVIFKYACRKKDRLCKNSAEVSCSELRPKLAYRLDSVHSSFIQKESFKQLNCFYESTPLRR
ncbi:MAG: hypothetical protein WDA09_05205 [Bacteriovoracaceae bacterium]